ncbi:hypothetical protein [Rhodosalinus sp.]|uniref:hypothetical protein n=1 Tax=Rhodosalinus sp. TaxID=2047741 RepID=UPI0035623195
MPGVILCYSLGGTTLALCERLAGETGAALHRVDAGGPGPGALGYAVWGARAVTGLGGAPDAPPTDVAAGADWAALAAPLWIGRAALPLRRWLERAPPLPDRLGLIVTSDSPRHPDPAFTELGRLAGVEDAPRLHLTRETVNAGGGDDEIAAFREALGV